MPSISDIRQFLHSQILSLPPVPTTSFKGQTVIVTGANTGLGLDAAKHIAKLDVSHLILACRNIAKGETAKESILSGLSSSEVPTIEVWQLDMSQRSSVIAFSDRASRELPHINALIANAGIEVRKFEMHDGNESTLTVNVISTFLLATLLLPKLRETAQASKKPTHITITGSMIHIFAKHQYLQEPARGMLFQTLNDENTADMVDRYFLSKLIVVLCVDALAAQMTTSLKSGDYPVIINNVNPAWCKTEFFRYHPLPPPVKFMLWLIGRTSEQGSRVLVHGASTAAGKETHGKYLSESKVVPPATWVRSAEGQATKKQVWEELVALLNDIVPGVTDRI